ncbi:MAG: type I restriction enzyme HsdR N-terminal domain-containing protein [Thermodesulfovibrionales bacterium]
MPEDFDRQRLVREKIEKSEEKAVKQLSLIRESIRDYLVAAKGYREDDIERDTVFEIRVDEKREYISVDYIINLNGVRFMVLKCSPGALESRERHLVSFARVVDTYQIPFAMVTDGFRARLLDTVTGKLLAEGLDSIPDRSQAEEMIRATTLTAYQSERMEREKRVLLAFEAIECTKESGG